MNNRPLSLSRKSVVATALSLSMIMLVGCEGGQETGTNEVAPQTQLSLNNQNTQIEALKNQLANDPNNEQLLWALGNTYFEAQRFLEAIPIYEQVAAINPKNAGALNDLGLAYHYIGESTKGLAAIDKATQADPGFKHAWLSKGFILYSKGRYEEAIAPLKTLKQLDAGGSLAQEADRFLQQIQQITERPSGSG